MNLQNLIYEKTRKEVSTRSICAPKHLLACMKNLLNFQKNVLELLKLLTTWEGLSDMETYEKYDGC